ncbi:PREDICTED: uncharacterized protein LOC107066242 isoform X2 [Polistes dominula]|nr:PREDICTED: uncharacterized protein LOC107066242 isoform X2 [Polistes dominula]XP_015176183.1 PREDICTED: uncharacterized protein LOC107066242 isoform X2 [Polistes dominula]XP_015176184.1 PREDICTED: uncharacterized protein LOC107066242 isoform X2 [Polistes dominula]XP_015176185.1 PREDICTED: uncharacterized protein LOC107066242 isoform X2 [Polistes dominula]
MEKHFAALKILDDETENKLTRTASFSDLPSTSKKILIEEYYQTLGSPSLVRQYSCEQIVDGTNCVRQLKICERLSSDKNEHKNEHKNTWKNTIPCINNKPEYINWNSIGPEVNVPKINTQQQEQIEYMEVEKMDMSEHNNEINDTANLINPVQVEPLETKTEKIENSNESSEKKSYEELKKKVRPLVSSISMKDKNSVHFFYKVTFFILVPIIVFLMAVLLISEEDSKEKVILVCDHGSHFSNASIELRKKIYGQNEVISSLIEFLEIDDSCKKFAVLVGSTGVGKSYTIDIIRRNFPNHNKIIQYIPPLSMVDINEIPSYSCNLIILENLRENDILDALKLSSNILKLPNTCITLLAVINVEKVDRNLKRTIQLEANIKNITAAFSKVHYDVRIFGYNLLNEEVLEKCIVQAMEDSHLKLREDQILEVKKSLLVSNSGCKGAYTKVQVIGR